MQISLDLIAKEILNQRNLNTNKECKFSINENGIHEYVTLIKVFTFNPIWNRIFYIGTKQFWYKDQMKGNQICTDNGTLLINICPVSETPLILGYVNIEDFITVNDCFYRDNALYIVDLEDKIYSNFSHCAGYCANCNRENHVEEKSIGSGPVGSGLGWLESVLWKDMQS